MNSSLRQSHESVVAFNESGLVAGWLVGRVPPHDLSATLVVKGTFELVNGGTVKLLDEQPGLSGDVPDPLAPGAIRYSLDIVPIKPYVDVIVTGSAQAPGGNPAAVVPLTCSVGRWTKTLYTVGDRQMKRSALGGSVTDPEPFISLPLTWSRSFGGRNVATNPTGRGRDKVTGPNGQTFVPLPNILRKDELTSDPDVLKEPAGFGPIPQDWPQRMDKARKATYDSRWLRDNWPAHPRDFDWSFFNAAPADQQIPIEELTGNDSVVLENLVAGIPRFTTRLPGVRVRWFFWMAEAAGLSFVESTPGIDTLWFDCDARQLVIVWRSALPVRTKSLRDLLEFLIVREPLDESPRPIAFYRERLEQLKAEKKAPIEVEPMPEIPPVQLAPMTFDWTKWESDLMKDKLEAERIMAALARDPDEPPPMSVVADILRREGLSTGILTTPRPSSPESDAAEIAAVFAELARVNPDAAKQFGPPPTAAELDVDAMAREIEKEVEADTAESPDEAPEDAEDEPPVWTRERVADEVSRDREIKEQDLSGLDLSGLDLNGARLPGSILERANLAGCRLSKAVLTGAILTGVNFREADLTGAELGRSDAGSADFSGADLQGAKMQGMDAGKAVFAKARLQGASMERAVFSDADFSEAVLSGAELESADLSGCNLAGATFENAILKSVSAYGVKGPGVQFQNADLTNFRTGEGADLAGAIFKSVSADGSVWNGSRLDGADFSGAGLREANFNETSLVGCNFNKADLFRARFMDADMENATAMKANLFRARFEGARLVKSDFRGASLYEAEFLDAEISGANFELANLKGTKLG